MKRLIACTFLATACGSAFGFSLGDIQSWVGSGSNRAGFVVQWDTNDSPQAFAWGIRFDGTLTGDVMHQAMMGLPSLYDYSSGAGPALSVYGIGYDVDGDGVTGAGFTNPGATPDDAIANDPDDRWKAGWFSNGYWSLWTGSGANAGAWESAQTGIGGLTVGDESWVLWAFAPASNGWSTTPPTNIVAAPVPEPATLAALSLGVFALRRRNRRS